MRLLRETYLEFFKSVWKKGNRIERIIIQLDLACIQLFCYTIYSVERREGDMKKWWFKDNIIYLLWGIALLLFFAIMADRYCRMTYGGSIFYVLTGENEITEEEKEYLKQRRDLIYGETLDSFPAQLYDSSLEGEEGFAVDMMEQISLEVGVPIALQPLIWPEVFHLLDNSQVDIIQISYSEEREKSYYLTAPLYKSKGVVFLRNEGKEVKQLKELEGRKIAGIKEDYATSVLKEKVPKLEILEYDSIDECAQELKENHVDGIVADEQNIMYYAQKEKMFQNYYMAEEEVYQTGVVFAVRKSDEKLGRILNKAVYKLRTRDTLDKLQQKWFLSSILNNAVSSEKRNIWAVECALGVIAFFVLLFFYLHYGIKKLVAERTRELNQEKRRLKAILDSIPQYLFEVNAGGVICLTNQQVRTDEHEKENMSFCDFQNGHINDHQLLELIEEVYLDGYVQEEVCIKEKWYRATGCCIRGGSAEENVILLMEDITLYRLQERQNMQNYKMAAIGQLASGVSHELRNPLEIICNCCYALKKGIINDKEDISHTTAIIEEEAKSANKIVDSLLSFARMTPEEVLETEIKPCILSILELKTPFLKKKKIEAKLICDDGIFVKCNPDGIKRIINNLLTNAEDALLLGKEGKIVIKILKKGERVNIEFMDNGKGMSEQEMEQIFNPFYTTKSSGTGLGLYLVYHQIEECNGSVQVDSREGEGTVFLIDLPA